MHRSNFLDEQQLVLLARLRIRIQVLPIVRAFVVRRERPVPKVLSCRVLCDGGRRRNGAGPEKESRKGGGAECGRDGKVEDVRRWGFAIVS